MRMRKKPNLGVRMERCTRVLISDPEEWKGKWRELMPQARELRLELGCGKGVSTAAMVKDNPTINYVAVDITCNVLGDTRRNIEKAFDGEPVKNVMIARYDISYIEKVFAPEDRVERIYINFCDPWPKSNQKKRRLTHGNFLKKYRQVLAEGGQIHFKTDNDKLFEWSLEEIPQFGFALSEVTRDLHADGPVGVMTDYERKFYGEGKSINRCVATMVEWTEPEIEDVPSPAE